MPYYIPAVYHAIHDSEGWYIEGSEAGAVLEGPWHSEQFARDKAAAYNLGRESREAKQQIESQ